MKDGLRSFVAGLAAAGAVALGGTARAQGPAADWRTFTTDHFRVYFPAAAEPWARQAASRLEGIRQRLAAVVGYVPPQVVDVIVADPEGEPNGLALPLLRHPEMVLWTTPPGPTSLLGRYGEWSRLVAVHETAHLVHLLRPSASPWRRFLGRGLLDLGPIPRKAPRWVVEGYATYLEGRLTGSGRPAGSLAAAVLRTWGAAGRLPGYAAMSSDEESWLGMSMAYLEGSAYLQWLVARAGPESLPDLWRRLTARTGRGFDHAFSSVFGEPPETLYGRFRAEQSAAAAAAEKGLAGELRAGELWEDLSRGTGPPAVSPDGEALAVVRHALHETPELVVFATGVREGRRLNGVRGRPGTGGAPASGAAPAHRVLYRLSSCGAPAPHTPRWLPGGDAVLFTRFEPGPGGFLHPDLYIWEPAGGRVRRVTRLADVREAAPAPDGTWAVAVRRRWGASQLVRVDLADGAVTALTEPSLDRGFASPVVSPDGTTLAYSAHRGGRWELVLRNVAGGRERVLSAGAAPLVADPSWSADGSVVFAVVGTKDAMDVYAFPSGGGRPRRVTVTATAALAPAPSPDGRFLYFLYLSPDGLAIHRIALARAAGGGAAPAAAAPESATAPEAPAFPLVEPGPARKVGLGRQELGALAGGAWAASARVLELGLRSGDVLGRLDVLALGAVGEGGVTGGAVAGAVRSLPVELTARVFAVRERPSRQPGSLAGPGRLLDADRRGVLLGVSESRHLGAAQGEAALLAWTSRVTVPGGEAFSRRAVAVRVRGEASQACGRWRLEQGATAMAQAGRTGANGWSRWQAEVLAAAGGHAWRLEGAGRWGTVSGAGSPLDRYRLGGVASSLLPADVVVPRVVAPALPEGVAVGARHEGWSFAVANGPVSVFCRGDRVWGDEAGAGGWIRRAGFEWTLVMGPQPLLDLPAVRASAGVARVLDRPLEGAVRWWLSLTWSP